MPAENPHWPLVVLTKLQWCEEREDFFCVCYRKRIKPDGWREFTYYQHPYAEWMNMKNYMEEAHKKSGKWTPPNDPFLKPYPYIAELLTNPFWDNGKARELCSIGIRWGIDNVQVNVSDKRQKVTASTTAETLVEALQQMEAAFQAGHNLWRAWRT